MNKAISLVEQLFWTMIWVLIILILAVFVLKWIEGRGGAIGNFGSWIQSHAGLSA